ncbi:MAG TPA: helix-turn-helix domain-containing protein [Devosia sp.]|jgi:AraC family transcriptional regulator of arabinose operon|uniref:helix-turn-helix domain-containing protein n=1 Tax=Devosia sp. TaxID=1871048 RepID=UPI002DDD3D90|nr:helix-turn-helix domain-containing protein [Devosia sp.]HEV2514389.1 helix-turn-helix domain-containing protein [Devosia sp.]
MAKLDTPRHERVLQLLTGHYHETSGYRTYREHGVDDWLLIHTISGAGRFGHAGGELIAGAGDWVLIRPATLHDYAVAPSEKHWELLWVHFQPRPDWLPWLDWPEVAPGLMLLHLDEPDVVQGLLAVHRLFNSDLRRREAFASNALEAVLLECDRLNPSAPDTRHDERVRRAMDFLDRNLAGKVSLSAVGRAVGLSSSRLAHLFRAETGQTVQAYLEGRRMQRAGELLSRTAFSVKQIAESVGYDSQFYFSQRFKRWSQKSPVAFRATMATRG